MMVSLVSFLAGAVLLAVVLQDSFEVMLLPRRVHRQMRLMRVFFDAAWSGWCAAALRIGDPDRRERFLGVFGALSMMLLFAVWAAALIFAFGLIEWSLRGGEPAALADQVYMSGVTFFTLGYGDVVPHTSAARLAAVVEAGTGIGFIAVVIGYLPVLYQLFSRREAPVLQLDARAGSPPTACTMLERHAEPGGLAKLDELLREWEIWASDLLESHLSYPMLVYYRSQHANQSWLAALAAVMDTCSLILVGVDDLRPLQARMTFAMARQVLVEMARSFSVRPSRYEGEDRLDTEKFTELERRIMSTGLRWNGGEDTREVLAALRATYEPLLDGLASALLLSVPPWLPEEGATDHWEGGHRGLIARRLIEQLADGGAPPRLPGAASDRLSTRLRARLRRS